MSRMTKAQLMAGMTDEQQATAKLVGNNTLEYMDGDARVVRHFTTDILRFEPDGTIVFNTSGHKSMTTKARLNDLQEPVSIWSDKRVWYARAKKQVGYGNNGDTFFAHDRDAETFVFADGMTYHPERGIENAGKEPDKQLIKSIRKFAKDFAKELPIEQPGPGDCFICCVETDNPGYLDRTHLLSHIEESYYVPRLLWNALKEARRGEYYFSAAFKGDHQGSYFEQLLDGSRDQYAKDVYAYIYKRVIDKQVGEHHASEGFCVR